jgi:AcrR family transcriptional regulator
VTTVRTTQPEVTSPETETETAPAEFRRRLLEGMAAAIRECGFRDSTVADVVRHARTSRRTFYEHFASKQACFMALLQEANAAMVRQIAAAVDPGTRWDVQVRQAIEAWIAGARSDLALTLSWIRDLPSLGVDARHLQREALEAFVVLIQNLSDTPELRATGVAPPSRQLAILLLGGLRELIATTVEDGGEIADITEVAVRATQALLGPRRLGPTIQRQGVAMDELGTLRARRKRQARAVVRLEREVTALRNRGKPQASLKALEGVLSRHRETLRQLSAEIDAADPKPSPCTHSGAVRVELSTGELAAWLCPDCDQQLPSEWSLPQEEEPQLPADFWETLIGHQIRNQDRSRRGLLAAIALLNKRKAEILMMFDHGPDLQRQMWAIDAEIARRVAQLPEADRGYLRSPPRPQ